MLLVWLVEGYGLLLFFVVSVAAKQEGRGKLLFLNCNLSKICCRNFFFRKYYVRLEFAFAP